MTPVNLQQWISHPEMLNRETLYELRTLVARYPYFQSARLLYLKNLYLLHDISFGSELRKSILFIADRRVLFHLIEGERYTLHSHRQTLPLAAETEEELSVDRTLALIDAFLSNAPDEMTSRAELDYSTDYTRYLLDESDASDGEQIDIPKLRGHELIDGFIQKGANEWGTASLPAVEILSLPSTSGEESDKEQEEEEEDEHFFTETLAKIYIKQQKYSNALEIIRKLSLKYPKKNAYFADQIRFLEKLIINANSK